MASKALIINAALHLIGEPESTDALNDDREWVVRIRDRWDDRVQLAFEKHNWNFCTTVTELTASDPTPEGWAYGFNKPSGCWRIIRVTNSEAGMMPSRGTIMYEDRGGRILTNSSSTFLKYVSSEWQTLTGAWSQHFADLVSAELALAVVPVTDSNENTIERLERVEGKALRVAKNWDAQQQPAWPTSPSSWQSQRFSGGTRNGIDYEV